MEGFLPPTGVSERLVLVKTFQPESTLTTSLPFVATVTSGKQGERRSQRGGGDSYPRGLSTDSKETDGARLTGGSRAARGTHSRSATVFLAIVRKEFYWGGREGDVTSGLVGEMR
jgi:hypothetical protein